MVEETASNVDLSLIDLSDYDAGSSNLTMTLTTSAEWNPSASSGKRSDSCRFGTEFDHADRKLDGPEHVFEQRE